MADSMKLISKGSRVVLLQLETLLVAICEDGVEQSAFLFEELQNEN